MGEAVPATADDDAIQRAMLRPVRIALYLAGVILAFMAIAPLFWMVSMSLKPSNELFDTNLIPRRPTLDSFVYVFTQVDFARFFSNSSFAIWLAWGSRSTSGCSRPTYYFLMVIWSPSERARFG